MAKGGARPGAGRKPKAEEDKIRRFSINAMTKVFGSEEAMWDHVAQQAQESFPHLKLLFEYTYGKPKETKEVTLAGEQPIFNIEL